MHLEIRTWRVIFFEKLNQFLFKKVLEKKMWGKIVYRKFRQKESYNVECFDVVYGCLLPSFISSWTKLRISIV